MANHIQRTFSGNKISKFYDCLQMKQLLLTPITVKLGKLINFSIFKIWAAASGFSEWNCASVVLGSVPLSSRIDWPVSGDIEVDIPVTFLLCFSSDSIEFTFHFRGDIRDSNPLQTQTYTQWERRALLRFCCPYLSHPRFSN